MESFYLTRLQANRLNDENPALFQKLLPNSTGGNKWGYGGVRYFGLNPEIIKEVMNHLLGEFPIDAQLKK